MSKRTGLQFSFRLAKRLDAQRASVRITPHRPNGPGGGLDILAESIIIFAPDYPAAPAAEPFELVNAKEPDSTGPQLYETRRMFHGPSSTGFPSLTQWAITDCWPNSIRYRETSFCAPIRIRSPCRSVLAGCPGKLVGYWPIEYCSEGFVLFPIRIEELILYREPPEPGVRSVCQMRLKEINQRRLKADLDVVAPDGRLQIPT